MSISDVIRYRMSEGRLFELAHTLGFSSVRRVVMSAEVNELIAGPWPTQEWKDRCIRLRADLDQFLGGSLVYAVLPNPARPYERKRDALVRQLYPTRKEIWEYRSVNNDPSLRVFGRF